MRGFTPEGRECEGLNGPRIAKFRRAGMRIRFPFALAILALGASCSSGALGGAGGTDGSGGRGGGAAGGGERGGSGGGVGGAGNADGGVPVTTCPAEEPIGGPACTGTLYCSYLTGCSCTGCCAAVYRCTDGRLMASGLDYNDTCIQGTCGIGVVCTVGQAETCNDNPDAGGINGTCTLPGKCVCPPGRLNPDSGRCLAP